MQAISNTSSDGTLVIVGTGLAGYHVARQARQNGHTGPISIIGDENRPAYDRPALSKAFLNGTVNFEDLHLDDPDNPLDVIWHSGSAAVELSTDPLGVATADGAFHTGDNVVIVTGSEAQRLPSFGRSGGAFVLRNVEDALALRERMIDGQRIAMVGGGFLALEAVSTFIDRGAAEITIIANEQFPGEARLGASVARAIRLLHEKRGVQFGPPVFAHSVTDIDDGSQVLNLTNGETVQADFIVCAIGATPATRWLREGVLTLDPTGAILCDDFGFTGIPGVWAAGDCSQWTSQAAGLRPIGQWQEAVEQAGIVAAAIMGAPPVPFQEPYFWSEQYDVMIQGAGRIAQSNEVHVLDGTIEDGNLLVSYRRDGEEIGILGMNRMREVKRWRKTQTARALACAHSA